MARTASQIQEIIKEKYKAYYSRKHEKHKVKIIHQDDAATLLEKVFMEDASPNITIDLSENNYKPKTLDSNYIRLDNLHDVAADNYHLFDGEVVLKNPKGIRFVKVTFTPGIDYHIYPYILKKMAAQCYYLNPWLSVQGLTDWLIGVYDGWVKKDRETHRSIDLITLESISEEVFVEKQPPKMKLVKWLWNPDYDLTKKEKQQVINEYNGKERANKTLQELKSHYECGISKNELRRRSGKSKPTVYKYWEEIAC